MKAFPKQQDKVTFFLPVLKSSLVSGGVLSFVIALLVFSIFGRLGFNPTDEGHFMAISRRLLEGQVPYRDFIWVRPPLTSVLHAPFILLGGDYVLLLSRFIAGLEITVIIWLAVWMLRDELAPESSRLFYFLSIIISYALTSATLIFFPWATLDGVLLLVIGLTMLRNEMTIPKIVGYIIIGLACLAKQSFVFAIPIFLLMFKGWRDWRMVVASLLPGILFVLFLFFSGALPDAWLQLTSLQGSFARVNSSYLRFDIVGGMLIGIFAGLASLSGRYWRLYSAIVLSTGLLLLMAASITYSGLVNHSFLAFGSAVGILIVRWYFGKIFPRILASMLFIVWMSSISLGLSQPVWLSGVLGMTVLMSVYRNQAKQEKILKNHKTSGKKMRSDGRLVVNLAAITAMFVSVTVFIEARLNNIYREKISSLLTAPLDSRFPGAAGIVSSRAMAAAYDDLNKMVRMARESGKRYVIVPEFAAWWLVAEEINPLPMDWTYVQDLGNNHPALTRRLLSAADALRTDTFFIVQKFTAEIIPRYRPGIIRWQEINIDFALYWEDYQYVIVGYIRKNYELITENKHFWLYQ